MLKLIEEAGPVRNVQAEAAVIGAMLCENKLIDRLADILRPEDFFEGLHGRLFSAIVREASLGRSVSTVTIKSYFDEDEALKEMGGMAYLANLTSSPGLVIIAITSAEQVAEMAKRRRLIDGLRKAAILAADMNATNEEVIAEADAAIAPEDDGQNGIVQISAHDAFWEMVEEGRKNDPGVIAPDIPSFNEAMGPARRHHLCVIGGRPGMGKTALAMSYALSAAKAGNGVLFVSLEMSRVDLMQRAAADLLFDGQHGVPYSAIRDDNLTDNARRRMHEVGRSLRDLPFNIVDAGSLTIGRLNMIVRRYKRRMEAKGTPLRLVVVDYLQLVRPDQRTSNPVEAISEVSRGLKSIAKTHDLAVFALAQLNRGVEQRPDKKPLLSDLRESGQIEQDADAVVFLYREEYYLRQLGDGGDPIKYEMSMEACQGKLQLLCAKRRNGEARNTVAQFHGAFQAVRG